MPLKVALYSSPVVNDVKVFWFLVDRGFLSRIGVHSQRNVRQWNLNILDLVLLLHRASQDTFIILTVDARRERKFMPDDCTFDRDISSDLAPTSIVQTYTRRQSVKRSEKRFCPDRCAWGLCDVCTVSRTKRTVNKEEEHLLWAGERDNAWPSSGD